MLVPPSVSPFIRRIGCYTGRYTYHHMCSLWSWLPDHSLHFLFNTGYDQHVGILTFILFIIPVDFLNCTFLQLCYFQLNKTGVDHNLKKSNDMRKIKKKYILFCDNFSSYNLQFRLTYYIWLFWDKFDFKTNYCFEIFVIQKISYL